jgi:hypothetical protein
MTLAWEQAVMAGIEARQAADRSQWKLGDLALDVETTYGGHTLEKYAEAIGVEYETLKAYRYVAERYQKVTRVTNLSWTHYRAVARYPDRMQWLQKAEANNWSSREMAVQADDADLRTIRELRKDLRTEAEKHYQQVQAEHREEVRQFQQKVQQDIEDQLAKGASTESVYMHLQSVKDQIPDPEFKRAVDMVRVPGSNPVTPALPPALSKEEQGLYDMFYMMHREAVRLMDHFPEDVSAILAGCRSTNQLREMKRQLALFSEWLDGFMKELPD